MKNNKIIFLTLNYAIKLEKGDKINKIEKK